MIRYKGELKRLRASNPHLDAAISDLLSKYGLHTADCQIAFKDCDCGYHEYLERMTTDDNQ